MLSGLKLTNFVLPSPHPARPAQNVTADTESVDQGGSYRYRGYAANNAFHPGRYFRTNQSYQQRRWPGTFGQNQRGPGAQYPLSQSDAATGAVGQYQQKPKVITIVRNGPKPRSNVKILLNRRSVQSYEQLVSDISEAFGPKHRHAKIRKLYSVRGKEVHGISDFFRDDDCFIAVSVGEANPSDGDVGELLEELFPEGNYAKVFQREWEKNQRRSRRSVAGSLKSNRDAVNTNAAAKYGNNNNNDNTANNANLHAAQHGTDKRDSGFDSSDASTNRSEPDGGGAGTDRRGAQHRPRRKMRGTEAEPGAYNAPSEAGTASPQNQQQQPQQQGYYLLKKMEKERMKIANEERERAKRRAQKMVEAERRAAEEEKRKRGLVPVRNMDNPFKRTEDPRDKEREEAARRKREEERRRREEERMEQERKEKEREEREQAERAARERMQQAEQKEREQEKERAEQEERERKKKEKEDKAQRRADKTVKGKDDASPAAAVQNDAPPAQKQDAAQTKDNQPDADAAAAATTTTEAAVDETDAAAAAEAASAAPAPAPAVSNKDQAAIQRQQQKEKRRQEREEKQQRKRAKTKIVRKTKEERQVSSDDYILERYDLGRKLGDGNFAVVRQSRKKETGQEFAVKVIDKAKLKGKEHMVENEIDIMKDCNHANIVRLFEEYETAERIYLVMELVKGGDLFDAITQSVKFGEPESALMVKDLCNALYYMHSRSIVHRDLKPENLLVHRNKDGSITLKLADFGLAMEVKELIYTVCGTPTYVAPEILTEIGYGLEVDMWAVGVITYILLCGFPPFRSPDRNQTELFEFIKAGEYEFLSPYWDSTSRSAKDLISRLLIVDRRKRYTSVDVLSHRWVVSNGQLDVVPDGASSLDAACKKVRRELEDQAKVNYDSYQRLKADKRKERERIRGEE
ncbi:serine/threonine-protein kinase DCLK3 [Elysia marginata]|uniref:non-specific serine/threonine protein kinase n=1 Tax=Elysia marginata TaxID=1093978 RepID=A0AAV4JB38_9GAST|nr:serine/threonine-protein kinase DCLK3 [Elysia marginata]